VVFADVLFFIAAIVAIASALGVVLLRNPFYAVLALAGHLVSLAALFLLLRAEFVAFAQVIVYAGAVMVLYVFVVAYVGGGENLPSGAVLRILGPLFGLALAIVLSIAMLGSALKGIKGSGAPYTLGFGTPSHIGTLLLTKYLFPFEAATILLLVAAVGAVVLARRRRGLETPAGPDRPEDLRVRAATISRSAPRSRRWAARPRSTREAGSGERPDEEAQLVAIGWYLVVSAIIFCIGAGGVMVRRDPLVVLLCLELMLNGGNLALVAFARMWGREDGQVFALIVMVVAACEVTVGLGLVVAIYRRRIPVDVDELSELHG
jgi:NADH-quinone oxidoreductase subunit J